MIKVFAAIVCLFWTDHVSSQRDIPTANPHAKWLVNFPDSFQKRGNMGALHDVRNDSKSMEVFVEISDVALPRTDGYTDGEVVDALEHYFWGMRDGLAVELGALDGSPGTFIL